MGVVAATVLAGGLYVGGESQEKALGNIAEQDGEEARERAEAVLAKLAAESGTLPQKAFRYVLGDDRVSTVANGPSTIAHIEEMAAAAEMGPLEYFTAD